MTVPFPESTRPFDSRAEVLLGYLDYFRSCVVLRITALPIEALHTSRLPSGWTPSQLVNHLTFVEMRWLQWGFEGHTVDEPWGDARDGRWWVDPSATRQELLTALAERASLTHAIVSRHGLDERGEPGPRWDGAQPATLERVLLHLVQEYARHAGHLDIVTELAGGPTGE